MALERSERFALRLTPVEASIVHDVAEDSGLNVSDVIRQAIRIAYADRFAKAKPKSKKK